jgi:biopolymer transport protein ExbD/biopolymer transport protein TolR
LRTKLVALHADDPERRVVLRGDSSLAYVRMRDIFAMAQDIGFRGVALTVVKRGRPGDSED